ncbi:MAG TPA: HAMP domain-containing sensor histidine kinase [Phycisphaerae bacterium]|nr:HAMP domain-containing sensor histidine kinase [Phycisphaerae bacterium]
MPAEEARDLSEPPAKAAEAPAGGGGGRSAPSWSGNARAPAWLKLPQKTTLILLALLIGVVATLGSIFLFSTRSMLRKAQESQVNSFAYGVSATLGDMADTREKIQFEFDALDKTPNLEFMVLTDVNGKQIAGIIADQNSWRDFNSEVSTAGGATNRKVGQLVEIVHPGARVNNSYAMTVPVFHLGPRGEQSALFGYLHTSFGTEGTAAQLRFIEAIALFTCMGVVLLAIPIANLIARHITVPIQRLAKGAHALADGDLSHRVAMSRGDELGELAAAFNRMADTVQQQQEDIQEINAGLEQKVHDRTAEIEKVNKRLQAEISEKEDFLRAVSHDLNAPLRNIAGMASMLAIKYADTLEKDALQRLDRIQKNVQVECELINELLELSRIKTRREKIERVDLHELITAVAEGFSSDLETRGITLRLMAHLPVMRCEKMRMRQAFQNLIDNAIKYMRADGPKEIRIAARSEQGELVISFADTGMGIAKEDLPALFHVFRRAKNATVMKVPGKGVGLASVKSIIENYNGRMWAESMQGEGTTFCMAIPLSHFEVSKEVAA